MKYNHMAKTKNNQKSTKQISRPKMKASRKTYRATPVIGHVEKYAELLFDPCNADNELDYGYGGEKGFIQRVVSDSQVNTAAGQTAGVIILHPQTGLGFATSQVAGGTTFVCQQANFTLANITPGLGFLAGVAEKTRSYAACISVFPASVSLTNMTGEYAMGVCSLDTVFSNTQTVDNIFTLLTLRGSVEKHQMDIKWFPGAMDDRYHQWNVQTNIDASDTNVVIYAYRSFPAALPLSVRTTNNVEWTARTAGGLAITDQTRPALKTSNVVATMHRKNPKWLRNIGDSVGRAASAIGTSFFDTIAERAPGTVKNATNRGFDTANSYI